MAKKPKALPNVSEGEVLVRVGANTVQSPNGRGVPIYPVVHLVWPSHEPNPYPHAPIELRWLRSERDTKPVKRVEDAKYVALYLANTGEQWVNYRCTPGDRDRFEQLRQKWGMWFLQVNRQGEEESQTFAHFNHDGVPFLGRFGANMGTYVLGNAQTTRLALSTMWLEQIGEEKGFANLDTTRHMEIINRIPDVLEELGGGPLPWIPRELPHWGKPDGGIHDEIVDRYLALLIYIKESASNKRHSEARQKQFGYMWHMMRRAKIFEIAAESYVGLHTELDRYCTEEIAQLTFRDPRDGKVNIPEEEGAILYKRQTEACQALPFPAKMPFDNCWFAIGGGLGLSEHQKQTRGIKQGGACILMGMLATANGEFHEIIILEQSGGRSAMLIVTHRVSPEMSQPWMAEMRTDKAPTDKWYYPFCLAPFILNKIVDCINDHQTMIVAQRVLTSRSKNKIVKGLRTQSNKRPAPPPFYTVYLKDKTIKEMVKTYSEGAPRAAAGHRFDVRGHWCYRVYRGLLPMPPADELKLENLKYSIYKTKPLDQWVKEAMDEKGLPPRRNGEWIAIKKWWKDSYVKGPDDAEYVPSTRRATKGPLAFDNKAHGREKVAEGSASLRGSDG